MRCDTCHREAPEVSRVVIYIGYNKKEQSKPYHWMEKESLHADRD